jgi:hypothetical protein
VGSEVFWRIDVTGMSGLSAGCFGPCLGRLTEGGVDLVATGDRAGRYSA